MYTFSYLLISLFLLKQVVVNCICTISITKTKKNGLRAYQISNTVILTLG